MVQVRGLMQAGSSASTTENSQTLGVHTMLVTDAIYTRRAVKHFDPDHRIAEAELPDRDLPWGMFGDNSSALVFWDTRC